jgi:hypothetical protein
MPSVAPEEVIFQHGSIPPEIVAEASGSCGGMKNLHWNKTRASGTERVGDAEIEKMLARSLKCLEVSFDSVPDED